MYWQCSCRKSIIFTALHKTYFTLRLYYHYLPVGLFQESESQKQLSAAPKGSILAAFLHHSASSLCAASKPNAPLSGAHSADRPVSSLSNNGHSMSAGNSFPHEHSFRSLQMTLENNLDGFADKPSSPTSENSDQESSLAAYMNSVRIVLYFNPISAS